MGAITRNRDVAGGLIVIAMAAAFFYLGLGLRFGQASSMGPGYLPRLLSFAMLILGVAILARGLIKPAEPTEWPSWRATFIVVLSPILFGLLVPRIGMAIAVVITAMFARLAQKLPWRWTTLIAPLVLSFFSCVVFVYLLKLPIKLWP
jgi:putative tricarboxylic transport membrane protein